MMDVFNTRGWDDLNLPLVPLRRLRRGDVVLAVHGTRGDAACLPPPPVSCRPEVAKRENPCETAAWTGTCCGHGRWATRPGFA